MDDRCSLTLLGSLHLISIVGQTRWAPTLRHRFAELWRISEAISEGVRICDVQTVRSSLHQVCTRNRKAAAARLTAVLMTWWSKLQQTPVSQQAGASFGAHDYPS